MKSILFIFLISFSYAQDLLFKEDITYGYLSNVNVMNIRLGTETVKGNWTTSRFSISSSFSFKEKKYRLSANLFYAWLSSLASMGGSRSLKGNKTLVKLLLPLTVSNIGYNFKIVDNFSLKAKQRTDFYLLSDESKIYTETSFGFELKKTKYKFNVSINKPLTKAYYTNNEKYISFTFYYSG